MAIPKHGCKYCNAQSPGKVLLRLPFFLVVWVSASNGYFLEFRRLTHDTLFPGIILHEEPLVFLFQVGKC